MNLQILLFSSPRILLNGKEIFLKMNKRLLGIIFYLAVNQNKTITKDRLCEVFWPDTDDKSARLNLRQALFVIKKYAKEEFEEENIFEPFILSSGNTCIINKKVDCHIDVVDFYELIKQANDSRSEEEKVIILEHAITLYSGILLNDFYLKGNAVFEEWLILERENCNRKVENLCRDLATIYKDNGDIQQAIVYYKKLLTLDPLLEDVYLELMKAYCANKERSKAINQYKECARILSSELNISPMAELRDYYNSIIGGVDSCEVILKKSFSEHSTKDSLLIKLGDRQSELEYSGIYEAFEKIVDEDSSIPEYLKLGLSKVFPKCSGYANIVVEDYYFAITLKEYIEWIAQNTKIEICINDLARMDEKSRKVIKYLLHYFEGYTTNGNVTIFVQ